MTSWIKIGVRLDQLFPYFHFHETVTMNGRQWGRVTNLLRVQITCFHVITQFGEVIILMADRPLYCHNFVNSVVSMKERSRCNGRFETRVNILWRKKSFLGAERGNIALVTARLLEKLPKVHRKCYFIHKLYGQSVKCCVIVLKNVYSIKYTIIYFFI